MKRLWLVLLLTLSCKSRDMLDSASIKDEQIVANTAVEKTIPEMDDESLRVLTKGLSEFSKPNQRVIEIDLSKRISQLDARQIYNSYENKYGAVFGCTDYKQDVFLENEALTEKKQSQEKINQAFTEARSTSFKLKLSFDDLAPFLKEVKIWQNILAESRKDLMIYPKRSCLFVATKDKELPSANSWHSDSIGAITVIWTIYGRRTVYTIENKAPANKKEILSPPYGSIIAFKNAGNPDNVEPVKHASPGKRQERLTFVTFFEVSK